MTKKVSVKSKYSSFQLSKMVLSATAAFGFLSYASAQTSLPKGRFFREDAKTNHQIPLNKECSAQIREIQNFWDTEHGSPRQVFTFNYQLYGFPNEVSKYTTGKAEGST